MPLISDLTTFNASTMPAGFASAGLCKLKRSFRTKPGRNQIRPFTGSRFLLLDDPTAVLVGGGRNAAAQAAAANMAGVNINSGVRGILTKGVDGAQLVCPQVSIAAGRTLGFAWLFDALEDDSQYNDFACFEAVSSDARPGVTRTLLCDVELYQSQGFRKLEWKTIQFHFTQGFDGDLIWTVANGQSFDDPDNTVITTEALLFPSCLAIDSISVSG